MATLVCEARVRTDLAPLAIATLCERFVEDDAQATWSETSGRADFTFGSGILEAGEDSIMLRAEAADEASLARVKFLLAMRFEELAKAEKPDIIWTGDGCDRTELLNFREMRVSKIADITPHLRRITLAGQDLARFESRNFHVKLLIPPVGVEPAWPVMGRNGMPIWPEGERRPTVRTYTVRRVDVLAGELDIDFVMHEDAGPGSAFALRARAGDVIGVMGPGGRGVADADWYCFVGDETAFPAIARMLEAMPATARGVALVEVSDAGEEQAVQHPPGISLRFLHRNGAEPGSTTLLQDAVRQVEWPSGGSVFAWAGVEFEAFRAIRGYWRKEMNLDRSSHLAVAYWRRGFSEGDFKKAPAED
ncbi:NADPH-dependent ferric siderophore reductase [Hyphomicrobiales bacterium]|nr:NADPH-dependent ferric siderophore reductase [Hyphomicrobiales bacterium]CAH1679715.1 NADPH-dependent ferric siderophore reductase [Hyphomicrobiales bacterium]